MVLIFVIMLTCQCDSTSLCYSRYCNIMTEHKNSGIPRISAWGRCLTTGFHAGFCHWKFI